MKKKLLAAIAAGLIALSSFGAADAATRDEIAAIQVKQAKDFKYWTKNSVANQKLVEYVNDVTNKRSKNYIPVEDRIAAFDMDGTLLCETAPCYFELILYAERVLHDERFTPNQKDLEFAKIIDSEIRAKTFMTGQFLKGIAINKAQSQESVFAGMTSADYATYVKSVMKKPVDGLTNLKWGEAFYLPMVEVIKYLQANNFTVYIVTGSDRSTARVMACELLKIPANNVIGTNAEVLAAHQGKISSDTYNYRSDDYLIRGQIQNRNVKMHKVASIALEIDKQPVLAFGNSSGDSSMLNYTINNNKYRSLGFFVICDDFEREISNEKKAERYRELAAKNDWIQISMRDDFKTIYGDNVKLTR